MKFLKYLLYALVGIFIVYLILCAAGPKKMEVSESMTMNASNAAIWEEISDFSKWNSWSPWHKLDPNMKSTMVGNPGEVGHSQSWVSSNGSVGTGSQKFSEVRINEFLKSEMYFNGDTTHAAYASFTLAPDGEGTKVTWSMDGETPFLFRGMALVMGMNKMIAEEYKKGLTDLKAIAEAKPKDGGAVTFEIMDMQDQWYVGKMFPGINAMSIDSSLFSNAYMEIGKAIGGKRGCLKRAASFVE
jgi:carbon monoxide dehydrogenase subunit G